MININWVVKHLWYGMPNYAQSEFHFLDQWTVEDLMNLKWILTIFFFLYFFSISYLLIRKIFPQKKDFAKILSLLYGGLFVVSGFLYVFGIIFNYSNEVYSTIRSIMGAGQSFIPFLVLYMIFRFLPTNQKINS